MLYNYCMAKVRKWQRFEGAAPRIMRDAIRASINPMGEITFDVDAYRRLGEPQAMFLLYEPETETVGLEPGHADEPNSVLVRQRHGRSNRCVRSMAFFKKHGILPVTTVRLPLAYIEGKVLVLDLKTAVSIGSSWKKIERADARRVAAAEIHAEREKTKQQRLAEKEKLKAERHQLSQERARLRQQQRELERPERTREREITRSRRDWELRNPTESERWRALNDGQTDRGGRSHSF
jgi:hypothetical protein